VRSIDEYVRRVSTRTDATEGSETLTDDAQMGETAALALRLPQQGIDFGRFQERFGMDPRERWAAELRALSDAGLLVVDESARLTERALLVSNEIAARFV
jgi:coproporphyrinogen III oxidase-like Fe-S oxidoreductase